MSESQEPTAANEKADKPDPDGTQPGLACPQCGCPQSTVYYTRKRTLIVNGKQLGGLLRRRQCTFCGRLFSTTEKVQGQ